MPKQKYKLLLKEYAKLYGVSTATIARYSKQGYPLDDQEQTKLLISQQKYQPQALQASANTPAACPGAAGAPTQQPAGRGKAAGKLGLMHSTARLQEAERDAYQQYQQALAGNNPTKAQILLKQWVLLSETLRKAEMASPDVAEQNNKSVAIDDLEQSLGKTFITFRQELEQLPARVATELAGKDIISIRTALEKEVSEIVANLYGCKWLATGV